MNKKTMTFLNLAFVLICAAILLFLLRAPEESTAKVPRDNDHLRFYSIKSKKEAEKHCAQCHAEGEISPLPKDHPPSYRCLFCHKRNRN